MNNLMTMLRPVGEIFTLPRASNRCLLINKCVSNFLVSLLDFQQFIAWFEHDILSAQGLM